MKKVLIIAGVALVLYLVLSSPTNAAAGVKNGLGQLRLGAEQLISFVSSVFHN